MASFQEIVESTNPHVGDLVIDGIDKVVRFLGVQEDEEDIYHLFEGSKGVYLSSCVIGFIPIRHLIDDKDYANLVSIWNLNNITGSKIEL